MVVGMVFVSILFTVGFSFFVRKKLVPNLISNVTGSQHHAQLMASGTQATGE
jgi:hypothetical protein